MHSFFHGWNIASLYRWASFFRSVQTFTTRDLNDQTQEEGSTSRDGVTKADLDRPNMRQPNENRFARSRTSQFTLSLEGAAREPRGSRCWANGWGLLRRAVVHQKQIHTKVVVKPSFFAFYQINIPGIGQSEREDLWIQPLTWRGFATCYQKGPTSPALFTSHTLL